MNGRVSIFSSGKMVSAGTKSELQAFCEFKLAMEFLVANGFIKEVKLEPKPDLEKRCMICGAIFQAKPKHGFKQKYCPECLKKKYGNKN